MCDGRCRQWGGRLRDVIDTVAKGHLHDHLRWVREALIWKLEGLSEYDVRRPLTMTGTNLLGLVTHNAFWDARYFGEVFECPSPEPLPVGRRACWWQRPLVDGTGDQG